MARLEVFWTETALKQRDHIFEYWNNRNKSKAYSRKLQSQINQRVKHLSSYPEMGKMVDFKNIRTISLGHHSLFYRVIKTKL